MEKQLEERAKAQQPLFYEEDICDEDVYDYYEYDDFFDVYADDTMELKEQTV